MGEGDVWIRCLSDHSVFVQSYYLDRWDYYLIRNIFDLNIFVQRGGSCSRRCCSQDLSSCSHQGVWSETVLPADEAASCHRSSCRSCPGSSCCWQISFSWQCSSSWGQWIWHHPSNIPQRCSWNRSWWSEETLHLEDEFCQGLGTRL